MVKTAVKTVLIILGVLIAVFAVFNFAFPQHMATATESIGNYDLAVKYASLRYYYTKNCDDLARCFDDSVLLGNNEYIIDYGERLIIDREYADVCKSKNVLQHGSGYDYDHWVNSKLAIAYYNTDKKQEALDLASKTNGKDSFVYGNALMALAAKIRSNKDAESAGKLLDVLEEIMSNFEKTPPKDNTEKDNLTQVIQIMRSVKLNAGN